MNSVRREVVRRLLGNATMTVKYDDKATNGGWCCIGYYGKNPLYVENEFAKFLIEFDWVNLAGGNEYYNEEEFTASDKLKSEARNMIYSVGDTVEYTHVYDGRKRGTITKENSPLGLYVFIDCVSNVVYSVKSSVIGRTRRVLTEKATVEKDLEFEYGRRRPESIGVQWLKFHH